MFSYSTNQLPRVKLTNVHKSRTRMLKDWQGHAMDKSLLIIPALIDHIFFSFLIGRIDDTNCEIQTFFLFSSVT